MGAVRPHCICRRKADAGMLVEPHCRGREDVHHPNPPVRQGLYTGDPSPGGSTLGALASRGEIWGTQKAPNPIFLQGGPNGT